MAKLNQIVAVVAGKKTRVEKEFGDLNKTIQKPELFHGLSRQYQPAEENGEMQPPESKLPQKTVSEIVGGARSILIGLMDAVATQETANCIAKSDVIVDGKTVLSAVPLTVLLFLEKQMNDLRTFVGNMPTLDPSERWTLSGQTGEYVTDPVKTIRTKKLQRPIVLYDATEKHPAQTQLITEDVTAGYWTTTKFATVMPQSQKKQILDRIDKLQEAVKVARESANAIEATDVQVGGAVLDYVFGQ